MYPGAAADGGGVPGYLEFRLARAPGAAVLGRSLFEGSYTSTGGT